MCPFRSEGEWVLFQVGATLPFFIFILLPLSMGRGGPAHKGIAFFLLIVDSILSKEENINTQRLSLVARKHVRVHDSSPDSALSIT